MQAYTVSPGFAARLVRGALFRRSGNFARDAQRELRRYRAGVRPEGLEHIPSEGPFIITANHYQRPGMGAWWTALAISGVAAERRAHDSLCWLHTSRYGDYRLFGLVTIPAAAMAVIIGWIARRYGFLPVVTDDAAMRAPMLRRAHMVLHREARPLALMPEAGNATPDGRLGAAKVESGGAIAWLSAGRVPVLPVAVFDDGAGGLAVRFGPAYLLPSHREQSAELTAQVMARVAALMPPHLRGPYEEAGG